MSNRLLPAMRISKMLAQVAFGTMPKTRSGMPAEERRKLVDELIVASWPSGEDRKRAATYFVTKMRALPMHSLPAVLRLIRGSEAELGHDGQLGPSPSLIAVPPDVMQLGPGTATIAGLEAVKACKKAGQGGAVACAPVRR